ncbi:M2 family metallopeptidase [Lysobacter capsici]|uniref:Dipeptidyl carboxypeptidase n=1 Tax=Lysobacter capsici AZ78 TaxID=1444315 RepID=A0A125TZI2_9GAMM|nr:M2 family metallopeptidase [Lysobacter capsici]KWS02066.1 Dipeptidyl carboxypeptidase [Lysobacter capsici AZ78]UOF13357.1 M2 family metallopeptidase [Lysobacter capsici]
MKHVRALLALGVAAAVIGLSGCKKEPVPSSSTTTAPAAAPEGETADQFIARVNDEYKKMYPEMTAAQWLSSTYINDDSQLLSAKANERYLTQLNSWIEQSKKFEGKQMSPATARAIQLLKIGTAMPAPKDPAKLAELTQIATRMEGMYGSGSYCSGPGDTDCRQLGDLEDVLRNSRDYDAQLDAWKGWHTISKPMRKDYTRFVELVNEGAQNLGYADTGELWRSGYDMSPAELAAETDRLWGQVKPLYEQLHCYTRSRLESKYGVDKGQTGGGMLPAHLLGNMWQQDWGNLWDVLAPYTEQQAGSLDINGALARQYQQALDAQEAKSGGERSPLEQAQLEVDANLANAKQMTERAQDFYVSLGMPKLPDSYWAKTQFIKPRDRDVVCHASAWDMNMGGDVRTKMCIKPNEEDFTTIYHELGHVYYYLAYNKQPPLFQTGAHDGFHEAIGDTIVLAMTPKYLQSIGMVGNQQQSNEALINAQMRMALAKVSFLPFGLMIDRWRWGVFDGSIKPDAYNKAWWELKAKYQGVAPVQARGEEFFDAGAKYHVPGNTPYTRYFLSHILQFQFYKSLCDAAGYKGPLYECSFYGNKAAGAKFEAMLSKGASQPWQQTMKELTGGEKMDATAVLEYFAPLQTWLKQQNEGKSCGWQASAAGAAAPVSPAKPAAKADAKAKPAQG